MNETNATLPCFVLEKLYPDMIDHIAVKVSLVCLYAFIMVSGLTGNTFVLYCMMKTKELFSVRKVFVVNLCIADLMIDLTALPFSAVAGITRRWFFGPVVCKLIGFIQASSVFCSSFTLAAIALDRYLYIIHPNRFNFQSYHFISCTCAIWLLSAGLASPLLVVSIMKTFRLFCMNACIEGWGPHKHLRPVFSITAAGLQYGVPLIVTIFCYSQILRQVDAQIRIRKGHEVMLKQTEQRLISRRRRTNRMTIAMVLTFMVTWLPLNVFNIVNDLAKGESHTLLGILVHCAAMASTATNPVIYSWFDQSFRKRLKRLFGRRY